ncbi:hypothetical protein [Geomonas limicola]|uniref:hypothetical protein n=1 Tax=Geomonas limicola TaxID=2740186 RepID=UPI001617D160|nr:hypothetical protein [Geomonas limicola]
MLTAQQGVDIPAGTGYLPVLFFPDEHQPSAELAELVHIRPDFQKCDFEKDQET